MRPVSTSPEVLEALDGKHSIVAIGVSGGKDSCAVTLATVDYLKRIEYEGKIVLIHSDLGLTEWSQSLPKCQELADHLGLELIITERKAGGMMERWESRWEANVKRYINLECVKLILPWSTASMRFCTSELKTAVICAELAKRYTGHKIINVVGIRREEGEGRNPMKPKKTGRAIQPVWKPNKLFTRKTINTTTGMATSGLDWFPIVHWRLLDVIESITQSGLELHEAYTKYHMSRVSCAFCILSNKCDIQNASLADENHELYRRQVALEIKSTFSFQNRWLGDANPGVLGPEMVAQLERSKAKALIRIGLESTIPKQLEYVKGWPTFVPSRQEAVLLADVRSRIGELLDIPVKYTTADDVIDRYTELLNEKFSRLSTKGKRDYYHVMSIPGDFETYEEAAEARRHCDNPYSDIIHYTPNGYTVAG